VLDSAAGFLYGETVEEENFVMETYIVTVPETGNRYVVNALTSFTARRKVAQENGFHVFDCYAQRAADAKLFGRA
jgi:hypothetical protein